MDADKVNEAAKHFAAWETINSSDPNNNYYCKWGFIKGAQWLMQQPLADRLTDEEKEKEKILKLYNKGQENKYDGTIEGVIKSSISAVVMMCLVEIFGSDLFNNQPTEV